MAALTQLTVDLTAALTIRLNELGHSFSPSHIQALVSDILQVCVNDTATVVASSTTDNQALKPPRHDRF